MRQAFQSLAKPNLNSTTLPPIPDTEKFTIEQGTHCTANDRAISIDIEDGDNDLIITICSLLEFELSAGFDARGMLDSIADAITLSVDGSFDLTGALTFGETFRLL